MNSASVEGEKTHNPSRSETLTVIDGSTGAQKVDIEHVSVEDDPRKWSRLRKYFILGIISSASMFAGLSTNVYNPSLAQVQSDLHATSQQISLSLSLFIIIQGGFPLIWTAISEIKGRKWVYLVSMTLSTVGCIVTAVAKTIGVFLGMRIIQAAGSSSAMSLGAATLADVFDPVERGTVMGIYYIAPLLGPSLGSIIGGALAQAWGWRATFWFLMIWSGCCVVSFVFFRDTFRKERSLTYQAVLMRIGAEQAAVATKAGVEVGLEKETEGGQPGSNDVEAGLRVPPPLMNVKLSLTDLNPITPIFHVFRRWNNFLVLVFSGLLFSFTYCLSYTCSLTLSARYGYDALEIGLVLLVFGIGSIMGSVIGGRYSDYVLATLKEQNGGNSYPEMRLRSTKLAMICFPPSIVAYGWFCEKHLHIATVCVALFCSGFFSVVIYSSALTYIIDANNGRSSAAVACNSFLRGLSAFIAAEVAVPIQDGIGDGGMYTLWAAVMAVGELMILLVAWKGAGWRERAEKSERA